MLVSSPLPCMYGWLSSLHHLSSEGLMANLESMNGSPSLHLTDTALVAAHGYVILALQTLNDCCSLGLGGMKHKMTSATVKTSEPSLQRLRPYGIKLSNSPLRPHISPGAWASPLSLGCRAMILNI
jgi:hypothetical protein